MKAIKRLLYSWIDKGFLGGCSSYNSLAVRKSCRSNLQARKVFAAAYLLYLPVVGKEKRTI